MRMRLISRATLSVSLTWAVALPVLLPSPGLAEFYGAGMVGLSTGNVPDEENDPRFGQARNPNWFDLNLFGNWSGLYGGKVGYFFASHPWLGLELETFVNQYDTRRVRPVTSGMTTSLQITPTTTRVITTAANVILRYPDKRVQPYVGIGMGLFFARASDYLVSASDVTPGLSALAGLRGFLTDRIALFGEAKWNSATLTFSNGDQFDIRGTYSVGSLIVGLSIHSPR